MTILNDIDELRREGLEEIAQAGSTETWEACRVKWLGRKGKITEILRGLGSAAPEERRALANLVGRLDERNLDLDLLDERARTILGYVRREELVIR